MRRDRIRRTGLRLVGGRRRRELPVILAYHRVACPPCDPQLLSVSPERFADHLELLTTRYEPVRLEDLVATARAGNARPRAVAITFDDGYADNLTRAKPLLELSGVPATVFAASGYLRSGRRFWWDELERLLLRPGCLPRSFVLDIGGERVHCELGDDAAYDAEVAATRSRWTVLDIDDPGPRQRMYRVLCARLREVDSADRDRVLERIGSLAEPRGNEDMETTRPLARDELTRLGDDGLIEIGAHTVSHPVLSRLAHPQQREEVVLSKKTLEEALGRPIASFAYPYGAREDFDDVTVDVVREAGFHRACTTLSGRLDGRTDPYRLPRFLVRDWTAGELERRLSVI